MSERLRPAARRVDHDFLLASDICVVEMADSEDSLVSSPPPTLRPVVDINSNSEDEVGNPTSDLNDPLQLLDCDALMNLDESDVDGIAMDKIGNVGDLFDAESTPLMSLMSAEPAAPSAAERDEVDGQTFLSFVSFKDLEHFSQHNAATDGGRLVRARFNKSTVATTSQLLASRRPRVLDIRLKTGQVISEAHARFAASALRIRPMANAGAVPVTNASANAGTAPEINAPAKSGAAPSADASAVRKAVGGRPRKSRSPPPPTSADCLVDPVTQQQITVLHEDYEEHYDVPDRARLPAMSDCTKEYCRLGCLCDSLTASRTNATDHCTLAECMLQCVCGYRKDQQPLRNKTFYKLLKGNESYYSKIDWSGQRQRRERKIPERFRDSVFSHESDTLVSRLLVEEGKRLALKRGPPLAPPPSTSVGPSQPVPALLEPPRASYSQTPALTTRAGLLPTAPRSISAPTASASASRPTQPPAATPASRPGLAAINNVVQTSRAAQSGPVSATTNTKPATVQPAQTIRSAVSPAAATAATVVGSRSVHKAPALVNVGPLRSSTNRPSAALGIACRSAATSSTASAAETAALKPPVLTPAPTALARPAPAPPVSTPPTPTPPAPTPPAPTPPASTPPAPTPPAPTPPAPTPPAPTLTKPPPPITDAAKKPSPVKADELPRKRPTARVKIFSDELKLLHWGSYVQLCKASVPADCKVYCMEHERYECDCLPANRRHLRIYDRFKPPVITFNQARTASDSTDTIDVETEHPLADDVDPPAKNLLAADSKPRPISATPAAPATSVTPATPTTTASAAIAATIPTTATSSITKMARLVQGQRFCQMILQEKRRIFDEDLDLTIRSGESVELVAWIRFHRIYHAGKMHIRVLMRRTGPMILVMRPNQVVAQDITTDIQDLRDDPNAPTIVRELLDPFISVTETSRYALLLCDGVKWELVGCMAPSNAPAEAAQTATPPPPPPPLVSTPSTASAPPSPPRSRPGPKSMTRIPAPVMQVLAKTMKSVVQPVRTVVPVLKPAPLTAPARTLAPSPAPAAVPTPVPTLTPGRVLTRATSTPTLPLLVAPPTATAASQQLIVKRQGQLQLRNAVTESKPVTVAARPPIATAALIAKLPNSVTNYVPPGTPSNAAAKLPHQSTGVKIKQEPGTEPATIAPSVVSTLPRTGLGGPDVQEPVILSEEQRLRILSKLCRVHSLTPGGALIKRNTPVKKDVAVPTPPPPPPPATPASPTLPTPAPALRTFSRVQLATSLATSNRTSTSVILPFTPTGSSAGAAPAKPSAAALRSSVDTKPLQFVLNGQKRTAPASTYRSRPSRTVNDDPTLLPLTSMPNSDISLSLPGCTAPEADVDDDDRSTPETPDPKLSADGNDVTSSETTSAGDIFFPVPSSVSMSCVQLPTGSWSRRLKILYAASATTALLPLQNEDDQWCMVAIEHVPDAGLVIPGSGLSIPQSILEQAAQTACARNFRVSFPLHAVAGHHQPVPQKGFGVYGIPNMPAHVFLGPFPRDYLDSLHCSIPYMVHIKTGPIEGATTGTGAGAGAATPAVVNGSAAICRASSTATDLASDGDDDDGDGDGDGDESSLDSSDECSFVPDDRKPVADIIYGCQAGVKGQEWYRNGSSVLSATAAAAVKGATKPGEADDSDDLEIIKDIHLATREGRLPKMRKMSVDQLPAKPERVFVARVPCLPPTTFSVLEDNVVVVKHPLKPEQSLRFSSIEDGKQWLRSLSVLTRSVHGYEAPASAADTASTTSTTPTTPTTSTISTTSTTFTTSTATTTTAPSATATASTEKRARPVLTAVRQFPPSRPAKSTTPVASPAASDHHTDSNGSSTTTSPSGIQRGKQQQQEQQQQQQQQQQPVTGRCTQLHNLRERERRDLMAHRLRQLGAILSETMGEFSMTKLAVLHRATATIASLEASSKEMKITYEKLKLERRALLAKRKQMCSSLSSDVKKVFLCFTETSEVPQHHKSFDWDGQQEQTSETRLQLDPSGSAAASAPIEEPLIDIEIETDLCDNLDNFLEVDMLSVEDPDDTQGPDNHHWSCYPVGKN